MYYDHAPSVINSGYAQDSGGPPVGTAPTVSQPGDEKRAWSAGHKKYMAHGRTVGASRAFSVRQVMTVRNGKTAAETDRSRGEARQRDFITAYFEYNGRFLRATNNEPRATIFSRAEGHSRRCIQFEFVAAKRHLSPRRPATGGAVGSKIKKFKFFCFFRRNLHLRVEYYTYKGRDHKE